PRPGDDEGSPRPASGGDSPPSPQLATTFTWAVDPQEVETNTWRPELVSRTVWGAGAPLSVTLWTVLPAGRVAPTCRVQVSLDVTVVVQVLPLWVAETSIVPVPMR